MRGAQRGRARVRVDAVGIGADSRQHAVAAPRKVAAPLGSPAARRSRERLRHSATPSRSRSRRTGRWPREMFGGAPLRGAAPGDRVFAARRRLRRPSRGAPRAPDVAQLGADREGPQYELLVGAGGAAARGCRARAMPRASPTLTRRARRVVARASAARGAESARAPPFERVRGRRRRRRDARERARRRARAPSSVRRGCVPRERRAHVCARAPDRARRARASGTLSIVRVRRPSSGAARPTPAAREVRVGK